MGETRLAARLKSWRRANGLKQGAVAAALGVSQAAVSRWESGVDLPSIALLHKITDMIAQGIHDDLAIDRMFIERLSSIEAIYDLDGVRIEATSAGMNSLWPDFSRLTHRRIENRMIGETRIVLDDQDLRRAIAQGEVALVSGISSRHTDFELDTAIKHRWVARIRHYGPRVLTTVVYEPCDPNEPIGIEDIFRLDQWAGRRGNW